MKKHVALFSLCLILHICSGTKYEKFRKIKICVIGAGPAGIVTARFLAKEIDRFEITVFEKAHEIGGQWLYTNKTVIDEYGYPIHSSVYKNLRTNGPKDRMVFPDWPVLEGVTRSYVPHYVILDYLKNYTNHFQLRPYIQFNTIVENVSLYKKKDSEKWKVTVKNLKSSERKKYIFDAVIVCNGHHSVPSIPNIPGLQDFQGEILSSHDYRESERFTNKRVIILGAGISGTEIGQELLNVASTGYLSHNHKKLSDDFGFTQILGIDRFENGKFILKDNSTVSADVLLFCTGYKYSFPFLDESSELQIDDNYISPLYKHIFNVEHPSMSFVGIPEVISSFLVFPMQSEYVVSILSGKSELPSKLEMLEDSKLKSLRKRDAHKVKGFPYTDELARLGGFPPLSEYYRMINKAEIANYKEHGVNFRDYNLVVSADKKSVKIIKAEELD